jgi:hypothetical protein
MLGRRDEALAIYDDWLRVDLPPFIRAMVESSCTALRGDREGCLRASGAVFASKMRDSEAIFGMTRNLAFVGAKEDALRGLRRAVDGGLYAVDAFTSDPWLAPIRSEPEFAEIMAVARERSDAAAAAYARAGGDRVLGIPPS